MATSPANPCTWPTDLRRDRPVRHALLARWLDYLAVSPSLYWDDHLLLDEQRLPAADPGRRDVYLAVGEREDDPTRQWPAVSAEMLQAASGIDLVADVTRFADRLRGHRDIEVLAQIIPGEQHATVWPAAITRGLVHLYRTDRQT